MKKVAMVLLIAFLISGLGSVFAQETGHYVNGVEGLKCASLPPPGFYWKMYNAFYTADSMRNKDGNDANIDFDLSAYALVNRFIWISDMKLLGADYGADIIIPVNYTDIEISAKGVDDDKFALGDIMIEPLLLSWHGSRYDAAFAFGIYMPTGEYEKTEAASPGKDFWTGMFTLGGTYYFDAGKTWTASILSRYEFHSEKDDQDITPGNDFHFEWGVSKNIAQVWDVGVVGYCQWQVTDDSGDDATWDQSVHDRVFAIGPEASLFIPSVKLFVSLRSLWEFEAVDRSEGIITNLTLTKIF